MGKIRFSLLQLVGFVAFVGTLAGMTGHLGMQLWTGSIQQEVTGMALSVGWFALVVWVVVKMTTPSQADK